MATTEDQSVTSPHGFVAWFDAGGPRRFERPVESRFGDFLGAITARSFGAYCRARPIPSGPRDERRILVRGDAIAVCWGWIANRVELADRLGRPEFLNASDAALALACYARWGRRFPEHVEGEFSCVILDRRDGSALAARDALGVKKIFFLHEGRRTWIASHLELMFAFRGRTPDLDAEQIGRTIRHGFFDDDPGATIFRGARQLLPGHVATFAGDDEPRLERSWRLERRGELKLGERDYDERFRETLARSVEGSLPPAGRILAELSGGLDSSTVAAIAASLLKGRGSADRLTTISYVDPRHELDERRYQRDLCSQYELANEIFELDGELRSLDLVGKLSLGLHSFQSICPRDLERLYALGSHVCLTGQGGDAVLGDFHQPRFLADLFRGGRWRRWWRAIMAFSGGGRHSLFELLRWSLRGSSPSPRTAPRWLAATPGADAKALRPERVFDLPARQELFTTITRLVPHIYDDPWDPVEYRHPLLGRSLVELMLRVPWEQLLRPGVGRVLQRRALGDVLPASIRDRTDKGDFTMSVVHRFRSLVNRQPRIRNARWLAALGLVEPRPFTEALERALHGFVDEGTHALFAATTFECWLEANQGTVALDVAAMDSLARWAAESANRSAASAGIRNTVTRSRSFSRRLRNSVGKDSLPRWQRTAN